jgi:hypothetical protein
MVMLKELITNKDLKFITGTLTSEPQGIVIHSPNGHGRTLLAKCLMRDIITNMAAFNTANECDRAVLIIDSETMLSELVPQLIEQDIATCYIDLITPACDTIGVMEDFLGLLDHALSSENTDKDYAVVYIDVSSMDYLFRKSKNLISSIFWKELSSRLMDRGIWMILTMGLKLEYSFDKTDIADVTQFVYYSLENLEFHNYGDSRFFPVTTGVSYKEGECSFGKLHFCSSNDIHYVPMKPLFEKMNMLR